MTIEHWPPCGSNAWIVSKRPGADFEIACIDHLKEHRWIPDPSAHIVYILRRPEELIVHVGDQLA